MGDFSKVGLKKINEILQFYHLSQAKSFRPTIEGTSNSNYEVILESGKKILIKVSNDKTLEQLQNEQFILKTLNHYQYPYALSPLDTIQGDKIYGHIGDFGVVMPFIEGRAANFSQSDCFQIGKALGSLHALKISDDDKKRLRSHELVGFGGAQMFEYVTQSFAQTDYVKAFNQMVAPELSKFDYTVLDSGIIHGDLYFDNALFEGEELKTLIDFEQSGLGRYLLDLGIAVSGSCLPKGEVLVQKELVIKFVEGYQMARKLKDIELEYLRLAVLVGFFSISLWRISRFIDKGLDPSKKDNYKDLLVKAQAFYENYPKAII